MKQFIFCLFISLLFFTCQSTQEQKSEVVNLKCEHMINPLGLDTNTPRFSWHLQSNSNGTKQISYQIIIGTDPHFTLESHIWDTGKIDSDKNLVAYSGLALKPFTTYFWGVQVWDNLGTHSISEISTFETGMIQMANWKGSWITDTRDIDLKPAPYFRKEFRTPKKVKSAKAYVAAAGLFRTFNKWYYDWCSSA